MFLALLTFLLVFSITGSPVKANNSPISVPLTSRLHFSNNGTNNLLERDRARVKALRDPSMRGKRLADGTLRNEELAYSLAVDIGKPPKTYNLLLDSGSGNTWIHASAYVETSTSFCTGQPVAVTYTSGSFSGVEYLDYVTVGPGLTVILQSIGVAEESKGFDDFDGIIGIGPVASTVGTLQELPTEPIPTVTDSLFGQDTISENVFGIFFQPYVGPPLEATGQITFGGTDPTKYNGNIVYTPITNVKGSLDFWGINSRITYGNEVILRPTAGIVDSGCTFIYIPSDAYQRYRRKTGAKYDRATDLLTISKKQYGALRNLNFHIGEQTYSLTRNAQIWPRSINSQIGGQTDSMYLVVCDLGSVGGQEDFSLGYVFMQRFYVAYDATNSRIGFAKTAFTAATTN
ncbi:aspartic peptidase A1 [Suillus decipiens]|nr:aspartic peptidase A1 [Suillus decipiens]